MNEPAIVVATGIVMARRGCNADQAFALLTERAKDYDMSVSELAECLLAERQLHASTTCLAPDAQGTATSRSRWRG